MEFALTMSSTIDLNWERTSLAVPERYAVLSCYRRIELTSRVLTASLLDLSVALLRMVPGGSLTARSRIKTSGLDWLSVFPATK
jgi:hypothetical protein